MISASKKRKREGQASSLLSTFEVNRHRRAIRPRTPTKFEDLSVELIREIFDLFWTEGDVLYQAFYNLNLRINKVLHQTKFHITESTYSFVPQTIHPEQIKSVYIKVKWKPEILEFLRSLSPKIIVSLKLDGLVDDDLIKSMLPIITTFQKLKTLSLHVPCIKAQEEQQLYQIVSQMACLKSCSIIHMYTFSLSERFGSPLHSTTTVNFTVRFIDIIRLDKLYAALPNLKRLAMLPSIEEHINPTSLHLLNSKPPHSLKYLHLRLIRLETFPFEYIELLLKTFPPTQLECLSIYEMYNDCCYANSELWFPILTMPTLKLKQLRIKLNSEQITDDLIQRLRQHFGEETQVIHLERDPHIKG